MTVPKNLDQTTPNKEEETEEKKNFSGDKEINSDFDFYRLYFEPPASRRSSFMDHRPDVITRDPHKSRDFYKIVIVGDYAVGKSSIVGRFCEDFFREAHATTVGIDYKVRTITLPNDKRKIKMEIFDTAGLDKFRTVASNYYQNASGVVIVYDLTDENSFENVENYLRELKYFIPPDAEILLMGNKSDLAKEGERRVEFKTADIFCEKMGISLFEVSAKTGENVDQAFLELAQKIREKIEVGTFDEKALNGAEIFVDAESDPPLTLDKSAGSKSSWLFWCCA